ncbi:UDP-glucose/GDP-mannose dehydrogenase family protein [Patescibacteria group bacterium]|nr:UDP-glucose/GDP-mannose dehydrogenase family protein [Patescibacteria group bacterium]
MKITVVGTGYVGLVTGTIFADFGNEVTCIDIDEEKVENLKKGISPIYEPGLEEVIQRNIESGKLLFSTDITLPAQESEVIFIAVGTPQDEDGSADLQYVQAVAKDIGEALKKSDTQNRSYKVIVNKSTVPVGTGDIVKSIISEHYEGPLDVVSNPEFLREGQAVHDCINPDRVVVGIDDMTDKAKEVIRELYRPVKCPVLFTDIKSAELIKYASNSYLAMSVSFINDVAAVCESLGGNVDLVSEGMKLDKRIGKHAFLSAGLGYGGSCFPKDVQALINISNKAEVNFGMLKAAEETNMRQKKSAVEKLKILLGDLSGKTIALWGLAFKPNTDDLRDAVSLVIIEDLLQEGVTVKVYDPVAMENMKKIHADLTYSDSAFAAVEDANGLIVVTEWDEFYQIDPVELKKRMSEPNVVDGRNVFDPNEMRENGFNYISVGRS